jgi:drug/metabolite transporter (DMT)-like permease
MQGVLGWLLFGEAITSQWVMGSVLMSVGILLVAAGQPSESKRA